MKTSTILGLNARTRLFSYRYNKPKGRKIANSKIQTAWVLKKAGIPLPEIYAKFTTPEDMIQYDWEKLPDQFALKPSRGLGGEGIIVVKKSLKEESGKRYWVTTNREKRGVEDFKFHVLDILEGAYSMGNVPDVAFIQEYVGRHKAFRRYAYRGTPDIRIIVFNKVPIMAMLRLPTKESGGRANLHQGAIGVGVDIATGITTKAIWHGSLIIYKPETQRKLHGIKIPNWTTILETAVNSQTASGLGYLGVDIVLHPEKGPMVLELNSQPGLQIQLANMAGLRKRLDRVDDLEVRDAEHGVKIAKALFAARFADRVAAEEGIKTINVWEKVKIVDNQGNTHEIVAKVDTGAWRTSLDKGLAKELGLTAPENILWSKKVRSALGTEKRNVINLKYYLSGRRINTISGLADRYNLRTAMVIGRRDLDGFILRPTKGYEGVKSAIPEMWSKQT